MRVGAALIECAIRMPGGLFCGYLFQRSQSVLPPITAYYVMRVGRLPLVAYYPPGDLGLADAVQRLAGKHHAVLLANHGPVVAGSTLDAAANAIEELEETAKLFLLLRGSNVRLLTDEQVAALKPA